MNTPDSAKGFTLVEVLVALAILAVGVGLVALGFRQLESRDLDNQANKINVWMQSLSDRSVLEGGLYGFRVLGNQLQAVSWFDHQWFVVEHEGLLVLPEKIQARLGEDIESPGFIASEDLPEAEEGETTSESEIVDPVEPLMVFMPSGEAMAEGEIFLHDPAGSILAVFWRVDGEIGYESRFSF